MIFLWPIGLVASSTIMMRLHVRATAITCFPLPFPSLAPSMIPGKSKSWILAPLYFNTPGIQVRVVNSYAAIFEKVPESTLSYLWVLLKVLTFQLMGIRSFLLWHLQTLILQILLQQVLPFYHLLGRLVHAWAWLALLLEDQCGKRSLCSSVSSTFLLLSLQFFETLTSC